MDTNELLGRLVDALVEARAARQQAELALKTAIDAMAEVRGLKASTHQVQYVNTEALGQINKEMSEYMPVDGNGDGVAAANFDLGKRLAEVGGIDEEVDDEID